jgi:putative ATP-dependent endonuclease of OLD family
MTVIIGENNVGKSALLRGLQVAFGGQPVEDDLFVDPAGLRTDRFVLDLRFEPWPGEEFPPFVTDIVGPQMLGLVEDAPFFAWRIVGTMAADGSGVNTHRSYSTAWPPPEDDDGRRLTPTDHRLAAFFLLDARRDFAEDQRSTRSFWGRLLSDIEINPDLRAAIELELRSLSDRVVSSSDVLAAARTELGGLRSTLGTTVETVDIEPLPGRVVEVARAVDVVVATPAGHALPMRLQGQGTRSVASLHAFRAFTEMRLGKGDDVKPVVLLGLEEPEAHLHPQAQRAMFTLIERMSGQRIVSSHSPLVTSHVSLTDIAVMRHTDGAVRAFQLDRGVLEPPGLSADDREKLERLLLRRHSECLFARLVILVEGDTEEAAIPIFARHALGADLESIGITLLNVGGSQNYKHFVRLLDLLKIPFVVLADGDEGGRAGVAAAVSHLGGALSPEELVHLPDGEDFESFLLGAGYSEEIQSGISDACGDDALALWGHHRHGTVRRDGSVRDYQSPGTEDRLVLDYCHDNKALYAAPAARRIVAGMVALQGPDSGWRAMPPALGRFFLVVSSRLWRGVV